MPLFFFDIHDGHVTIDDEGLELADMREVRKIAMDTLPKVAADEIPVDGDKQNFVVIVRNEDKIPVFSATLSYVGTMLT